MTLVAHLIETGQIEKPESLTVLLYALPVFADADKGGVQRWRRKSELVSKAFSSFAGSLSFSYYSAGTCVHVTALPTCLDDFHGKQLCTIYGASCPASSSKSLRAGAHLPRTWRPLVCLQRRH